MRTALGLVVAGLAAHASASATSSDAPTASPESPAAESPATPPLTAPGRVVIVAGTWAFPEAAARELCPERASVVRIALAPRAADALDPFAALLSTNDGAPDASNTAPGVSVLDLERDAPGDDEVLAERVRVARCVVLFEGTWLGWWLALEPNQKPTALGRALREAHRAGATIVGTDAAGCYLGGWSLVSRAQIQRPARDPHDLVPDVISTSFALAPGFAFDRAQDARTTPASLLGRLANSAVDRGVWLEGDVAWIQDATRDEVRVIARGGRAFVFDAGAGRRTRGALRGARWSVIEDGAGFDRRARHVLTPDVLRARLAATARGATSASGPAPLRPDPARAGTPDTSPSPSPGARGATSDWIFASPTLAHDGGALAFETARVTFAPADAPDTGRFDWEPIAPPP